jgi:hypothetical protein
MSNQQLPFDPENLMWPTQWLNIENPPFVPQINVDQRAANYLPVISGLLMQEIQNNAQPGRPLRVFMYNLYSNNGWANENFARTVAGICDWFIMAMETNQYRSEQDCLTDIVPKMAELAAATQLRDYPALEGYIDANMHNATVQLINNFDGIAHQIQSYMSRQQQGSQWGNRGQQQQGGGWQDRQRGDWQGRRQTGGGSNWEGSTQRQTKPLDTFGSGGSNLFSGRQAGGDRWGKSGSQAEEGSTRFDRRREEPAQSRSSDVEVSGGAKMDDGFNTGWRRKEQQPAAKPTHVEIEQTGSTPALNKGKLVEAVQEAVEVLADEAKAAKLVWKPSIDQPYPLAYNPRTQLLYLRKETSHAAVIQVVKDRQEGSVDYEKHKIVRSFGPGARKLSPEENQKKLEAMRQSLEPRSLDDPTLTEEARALLKNRVVSDAWIMETSQDLAWVVGLVGKEVDGIEGTLPDVYHRRAKICVPVVGLEDQSAMIRELGECDTYEALKLKLLALGSTMNPELWQLSELKMTEAVNRVLSQRMSIDDIRITSFIEDVTDVVPVIGKAYGRVFVDAFNVSAQETIAQTFQTVNDGMAEEIRLMTDNILANYTGEAPNKLKFTYLISNVTMTYLSCMAQELEIELDPKKAVLVTINTPFVRELLADILERVSDDFEFDRHFIRTADGRVLELTQGLLGSNSLLLRCVR